MADRSRSLGMLIVAGVVVVVGGALAVVFLWWMPRQDRAEAKAQVEAWEKRWTETRACLLGEPTLSADPAEALALRELVAGTVSADRSCTEGVRWLSRGGDAMSPLEHVEQAWLTVETAIPPLAEAYVMWISAEADERDRYLTALGTSISTLDAAQDELRRAAGMPALTRTGTVTVTRLPEPTPVIVEGHVVGTSNTHVQAGVITTQEFGGGQVAEVLVTAVGLGRVITHTADEAFSLDGSWRASAVQGPADTGISPAVVAIEGAKTVTVIPPGQTFVPLAALGNGAERSILLEYPQLDPEGEHARLALARSTDSGATWTLDAALPVPPGRLDELRLDVVHGMIDVLLEDVDAYRIVHLDAARPLEITIPPTNWTVAPPLAAACRKGAALWWSLDEGVGLLDGGTFTAVASPNDNDGVIDCTATAVLVQTGSTPVVYERCDAKGCQKAMTGGAYTFGRAAMLDTGAVVYAAARGRMIAAWNEGLPEPRFFKLTAPLMLHALVVWYDVPYALLYDPEDPKQALVSVPLK